MTKQTRQLPLSVCEAKVREAEEGKEGRVVEGYAAVFGVRSVNLTPWSSYREVYEVMEPGSIDEALINRSDVIFNYCHENRDIFGRSRNGKGTLKLSADSHGLKYECEMPNTQRAKDTCEGIDRGDIYGNSFCFTDDEEDTENGVSYERMEEKTPEGKEVWLRHVKKCTGLYDVSIVVTPAYPAAEISQRELGEKAEKDIEAIIKREAEKQAEAKTRSAQDDDEENRRLEEAAEKARMERAHRAKAMQMEAEYL